MLKAYLSDESGATAIEYGLMAALIGAAIIIAVDALGVSLGGLYDGVAAKVTPKIPG